MQLREESAEKHLSKSVSQSLKEGHADHCCLLDTSATLCNPARFVPLGEGGRILYVCTDLLLDSCKSCTSLMASGDCSESGNSGGGGGDDKWKLIGGIVAIVAAVALGGVAISKVLPKSCILHEKGSMAINCNLVGPIPVSKGLMQLWRWNDTRFLLWWALACISFFSSMHTGGSLLSAFEALNSLAAYHFAGQTSNLAERFKHPMHFAPCVIMSTCCRNDLQALTERQKRLKKKLAES